MAIARPTFKTMPYKVAKRTFSLTRLEKRADAISSKRNALTIILIVIRPRMMMTAMQDILSNK